MARDPDGHDQSRTIGFPTPWTEPHSEPLSVRTRKSTPMTVQIRVPARRIRHTIDELQEMCILLVRELHLRELVLHKISHWNISNSLVDPI